MQKWGIAALGFVGMSFHASQAPQVPFTLKVETRLVVQTVSVTDKNGKPLEGLTIDDFAVTEAGTPQRVSVFDFEKIDESAPPQRRVATPPSLQRGTSALPTGDTYYQDRRLLALYFDLPSLSEEERFRAIRATRVFIAEKMTAGDLVALITFSDGSVRFRCNFTDDVAVLQQTLDGIWNGDDLNDTESAFGQTAGEFTIFNTDRQLAALQTAVNMLAVFKNKKSLIHFTGGVALGGVENQAQLRATLNAARRANVTFYPVDSRGLVALLPAGDARSPSPGGIGIYSGSTFSSGLGAFQQSQDALYTLAADTGGKALTDYNDLSLGIVQAQRANSSYYIIGYYPTNTAKDGKLRRVKITLKNVSAALNYRETYYADKVFGKFTATDKERQLEEALMLEDPITDLPIAMELNYFQVSHSEYFVPLAVRIPGSDLVKAQRSGAEHVLTDFIGEIKDEYGTTISNIRDSVDTKVKGESAARLESASIRYDAGYTLLPAKYTIKFLARNAETGNIGTFQTDFVIPNLNKETTRLPISSVVLGAQRASMEGALFNAGKTKAAKEQTANPLVDKGYKLLPSIARVFSKRRDLYVYLEAYEREADTMHPLLAFVGFYNGKSKVFEVSFKVSDGMNIKSKSVPIKITVPLSDLGDGNYVCQITIVDPTRQKVALWQSPIRIVP